MILSNQSILARCTGDYMGAPHPLITPFLPEKEVINGKSAGLSSASYDARIEHDLVLGVSEGIIIARHVRKYGFERRLELEDALRANPPARALAFTVEDFCIPNDVSGAVVDKSSYARVFVSAFNTFFDPGFHGNATLELVNLGEEPVTYKAGDPVCQFIFSFLDQPTIKPYDGKYQHQTKAAHAARYERADGTFVVAGPAASKNASPPRVAAPAVQPWMSVAGAERDDRQVRMKAWIEGIWGSTALHPHERVERLYEEVCELAQGEGVRGNLALPALANLVRGWDEGWSQTAAEQLIHEARIALRDDRLAQIATQVYAKPVTENLAQEVGGISTCLLAYCEARDLSADACEAGELARITAKSPEHFRERHARKIASGMARPLEAHGG